MNVLQDGYYRIRDIEEMYPNLRDKDYVRHLIRKYNIKVEKIGNMILVPEDQLEIFHLKDRLFEYNKKMKRRKSVES